MTDDPIYKQISKCRLCGSHQWDLILNLGEQYVCDFVDKADPSLPRAPLELIRCSECGLLQLKHSFNRDMLYREYWYRSSINHSMRSALLNLVEHGLKFTKEGTWLDIGANDGFTLSRVPSTFRKIACEPALNLAEACGEHADLVISDYFKANDDLRGKCNVITSAAMFYDLDDPDSFVRDIASCLTSDGVWINQLTDTKSMLAVNDFPNIVHEHVTYWDIDQLKRVYNQNGLKIVHVSFNDVNGGSIRTVASKNGNQDVHGVFSVGPDEPSQFAERVRRWKQTMTELLMELPSIRSGDVWGYAASTKGCTMLQYLDLNDRFVAIADRNPLKHRKVMAGTWLPIVDEATFRRAKPATVVPLAWAFREEFMHRERELIHGNSRFLWPLPNPEIIL